MQSTPFLPIILSLGTMILAALPLHAGVRDKVSPVVPIKAEPFSLSDVRLLPGPFQHAQEMDRRYLRSLEPDRLLHNFRLNAGLPSSAQPLGGWEAPNCELRGHFVGHYLSACARMFASTGDETLKKNAEYVVAELAKCQDRMGSGYLSAYPESFIDRVERAEQVWAPWYTLHKIFAGLMDVAELCGDARALEVARKMGDWAVHRENKLSDAQFQKMLGNEHGGMNETLSNLYALTGDKDYLALSLRFNHHAVLDPLMNDRDILTGLHANTQIPKVIGLAREFELTGDAKYAEGAKFFWDTVTKERSYVIGGNSDGEYFSPKEKLSQFLSPHTTETCNTYNMLKLTRHLFTWNPSAEYADYYERALFNHILASQNPETGMMCYYVPLRSGAAKEFNSPNDSFWCCTGTGVENHSQYGDSIYFHSGDTLYVNLFIASELQWKAKGVAVRQETDFPTSSASKLRVTCAKPARFTLQVRCPGWTQAGFAVQVNGHPIEANAKPGSYLPITRQWKSGDTVEIAMPMTVRTEAFRDNPHKLAFLYGPIVLCAPSDPHLTSQAIVSEGAQLAEKVKPVEGKPLTFVGETGLFRVAGETKGREVTLTPFYGMYADHYVVYWDVFNPANWQQKEAEYQAEETRLRDLEARTVDSIAPGNEQNERDHKLASERSYAGDFAEKKWRDARDGGFFSYALKVLPDAPQELAVTYWGSDVGRKFDILIDGELFASQTLELSKPNAFFDAHYALPAERLKGKTHIIVKFQAPARGLAGGIFGIRILKK